MGRDTLAGGVGGRGIAGPRQPVERVVVEVPRTHHRVGVADEIASIPGPQKRGTGGTLIVAWKDNRHRGHPPGGGS